MWFFLALVWPCQLFVRLWYRVSDVLDLSLVSKRFGFWPHNTHVIVLISKKYSICRTIGLSDRRTIALSDYRSVGLSDCRIIGRNPYKSVVRPILEYATCVWSPSTGTCFIQKIYAPSSSLLQDKHLPFSSSPLRLNIFRLFVILSLTHLYRYTPEIVLFSTATFKYTYRATLRQIGQQ
jgi:hypothetical protein